MNIIQEMWDTVIRVFTTDSVSLIIMLVVVVAAGIALGHLSRIVQVTIGALVGFGLLRLAYAVVKGAQATALPTTAWNDLKVMTVSDLAVFFIAFAIVISIVHTIRRSVGSSGH